VRSATSGSTSPGRPAIVTVLEWDSALFGRRVGRAIVPRLTLSAAQDITRACAAEALECVYVLTASDDAAGARVAEAHGFHFVDVRLTLARATSRSAVDVRVRASRPEDVPALQAIARVSHHDSRFYFDGRFPDERCDELYAAWIANACRGRAKTVLVADADGRPAGYLSITSGSADEGQIDLLAVDAAVQRRGLGAALVAGAVDWCAAAGFRTISVVTQGRNVGAQRLYQRHGFMTTAFELWYHYWPSDASR
jgi:ribosomal protein S18 acetylase RimI-like enzyme